MTTQRIFGSEIRPGDTIEVWWTPQRDTVLSLRPYRGPLEYLFPKSAQLAEFALNRCGMTIDNADLFTRIAAGAA